MTWQQLAQKHVNENTRIAEAELRDGIGKDINDPNFTMKWADRKKQLLSRQHKETSTFIEEEIKMKRVQKLVHESIALSQKNAAWLDNGMKDVPEKTYEEQVWEKYSKSHDETVARRAAIDKEDEEKKAEENKIRNRLEKLFNKKPKI